MERIEILETENTPKVFFDPDEGLFSISGSSLPENADDFYRSIVQKLEEYIENIAENVKEFNVSVRFLYYNSGSMRYIAELFMRMAKLENKGVSVNVDWFYEQEDELLLEAGKDLSDVVGLKFNFIETNT